MPTSDYAASRSLGSLTHPLLTPPRLGWLRACSTCTYVKSTYLKSTCLKSAYIKSLLYLKTTHIYFDKLTERRMGTPVLTKKADSWTLFDQEFMNGNLLDENVILHCINSNLLSLVITGFSNLSKMRFSTFT